MKFDQAAYEAFLKELEASADPHYKAFHEKLIPGKAMTYGIRLPVMRKITKDILKNDPEGFLSLCKDSSYEETMIHGLVAASLSAPTARRLQLMEAFLPKIDNWAVCDSVCNSFRPKKGEREAFWQFLQPLFLDEREFYARFALVMLLCHFVTEDKIQEDLMLLQQIKSSQYYVEMAAAWALAECYTKFPAPTLVLLQQKKFSPVVQNKGIQKIRESRRISPEEKAMLLQYKQ